MFSYSRLQTFEQCPQKYKFRYLDNLRMDTEGIEAFVGKRAHETLEKLYRDLRLTKLNTLEDLQRFYEQEWEKSWHGDVQIVQPGFTPGHYFALGQRCIADYYRRHYPFNQSRTLALEDRIEMKLRDGEKTHTLQGYIDRLSWVPDSETYEIHDYKTGNTVPTQEDADRDRQLALYQLGIQQRWPDAKNVTLVWHYLAADKELSSTRKAEDLERLEKEIVGLIHGVEQEHKAARWEPRTSRLCDWCEYRPLCPAWKHPVAMQTVPVNEYLQNSGVALVKTFADLEAQKADHQAAIKTIEGEQTKVKQALEAYAAQEKITVIDGPEHRIVIRNEEDFQVPRKSEDPFAWELLRTTLKNAGKLEDVSTVNGNMLKFALRKGQWPADVIKSILGLVNRAAVKTISLVKKS